MIDEGGHGKYPSLAVAMKLQEVMKVKKNTTVEHLAQHNTNNKQANKWLAR